MIPALILAGGLGTRLREVVGELPKPLANVAGRPFLWWLLKRLQAEGISETYLSVGYRHELVEERMGSQYGEMALHYVVEMEPLGTGGGIRQALQRMPNGEALVLNGDTLALLDNQKFIACAHASGADVAMALVRVEDASRYGTVLLDEAGRVRSFVEKGASGAGLINAGVYWMRTSLLKDINALPERFSWEQDFLAPRVDALRILGVPLVNNFIDIGIPHDYALAQRLVPEWLGVS